ncbi:unnamed protein product, partial [Ectocarpus sp. 8 AP-2014]
SSGASRGFDALIIAISQVYEGRGKRWYTSTLELRLASLETCRACRRVPTIHVRVDANTPPSLWSPRAMPTRAHTRSSKTRAMQTRAHTRSSKTRGMQTRVNARSSKARISSRVPVGQALGLTWALPTEILLQGVAVELWIKLEFLQLRESLSPSDLVSVAWPQKLKRLALDTGFEAATDAGSWPASLESVTLGNAFNQAIAGAVWGESLLQISFGARFDQPVVSVVWPGSLQEISFGRDFNQ